MSSALTEIVLPYRPPDVPCPATVWDRPGFTDRVPTATTVWRLLMTAGDHVASGRFTKVNRPDDDRPIISDQR